MCRGALSPILLHEDRHVLALNKPAGMLSQPDRTGDPSIIAHCHSLGWPHRLWTVHRLDRRVSGCLLLARSHKVAARLASAFRTREVVKHYLAVVHTTAAREGTMATGCYGRLRGCAAGGNLHASAAASAAASAGASAGASAAGKSGRSVGEGVGEKGRSSDHASTLHAHSHAHSHHHARMHTSTALSLCACVSASSSVVPLHSPILPVLFLRAHDFLHQIWKMTARALSEARRARIGRG